MILGPNSNWKFPLLQHHGIPFFIFNFCLMVALLICSASVAATPPHILIDAKSGQVLIENKPDHKWYPASLTKLMTAYVTFRAIKEGDIELGSPVVISSKAVQQPPSKMGYKQGTRLRIDSALKIVIIKSANDVSIALAEAVSGSEKNFVKQMNAAAQLLGMNNTRFINSNGLHNQGQYTSARDMAILSSAILNEFPQYAEWFSAVAVSAGGKTHYSYNLLLERLDGATGMKTGFVCASGYNMVASAERSGRRLIAVVLGRASQTERAVDAAKLLLDGFNNPSSVTNSAHAGAAGDRPINMRPALCNEKARASRYDPAGGQAIIKSEYLHPRVKSSKILTVTTGGIDAGPGHGYFAAKLSDVSQLPVPIKSPGYQSTRIADVDWKPRVQTIDGVPVPMPRPR